MGKFKQGIFIFFILVFGLASINLILDGEFLSGLVGFLITYLIYRAYKSRKSGTKRQKSKKLAVPISSDEESNDKGTLYTKPQVGYSWKAISHPVPRLFEDSKLFPDEFLHVKRSITQNNEVQHDGEWIVATGKNTSVIKDAYFKLWDMAIAHVGYLPSFPKKLEVSLNDIKDPAPLYDFGGDAKFIGVSFNDLTPTGKDPKYVIGTGFSTSERTGNIFDEYGSMYFQYDDIIVDADFLPSGEIGKARLIVWSQRSQYLFNYRMRDDHLLINYIQHDGETVYRWDDIDSENTYIQIEANPKQD